MTDVECNAAVLAGNMCAAPPSTAPTSTPLAPHIQVRMFQLKWTTNIIYLLIVCSQCCLPIIDVTDWHSLQEFSPLVIYSNKFPHFPRKQFSRPRIIILVRCENASPTRRLRVSWAGRDRVRPRSSISNFHIRLCNNMQNYI